MTRSPIWTSETRETKASTAARPSWAGDGDGRAHADDGQQEREDDGAPHGCGYNAVAVLNANQRSARAERFPELRDPGPRLELRPGRQGRSPRAHGLLHRELGAHRREGVAVPAGPPADARVPESLPRGAAPVGRAHRGAAVPQSPLAQLYFAAYQEVSGIPRSSTRCSTTSTRASAPSASSR